MIVGIVGAGAIGTLFGASLAGANEVRVFVRTEAALRAIEARGGLQLEGTAARPVLATRDPSALGRVELLAIAVKAPDTVDALLRFAGVLASDTPIVSLQNGLDAVAHVDRALGAGRHVALGPTTEAALALDVGFARRTGAGATTLGWAVERGGDDEVLEAFAASLRRAGFAATVARPIEPHVWAKAIANAAINPLTALAGVTNGALLERPDLACRLFAIAREAAQVARALGIALPFDDPADFVAGVARATSANRSSMLRDLECGRMTEIDDIDGAIVRAAATARVAVPETTRALDEVRARTKA